MEKKNLDLIIDIIREQMVAEDGLAYKNCIFDVGRNSLYCAKIVSGTENVQFLDCLFLNAIGKGIVGEHCSIRWCTFEGHGQDGFFATQISSYAPIRRRMF